MKSVYSMYKYLSIVGRVLPKRGNTPAKMHRKVRQGFCVYLAKNLPEIYGNNRDRN